MPKDKSKQIEEALRKSINLYFAENADVLGFCFVHDIIMSGDLRSSQIVVEIGKEKDLKVIASYLENSKGRISKFVQKSISVKYFPALSFRLYQGEENYF